MTRSAVERSSSGTPGDDERNGTTHGPIAPAVPDADGAAVIVAARAIVPERELVEATRDPRSHLVRWSMLVAGLFGWGVAIALMLASDLGLGPWDAFHKGMSLQTGLSVGMSSILAGLVIMLASMPFGIRPGPGTIANMILVGVFVDALRPLVPSAAGSLALGVAYYAVSIAAIGIASGAYIGAGLGQGPRDALMMVISGRTGYPVRRVRTAIELTALAAGWAMGGKIWFGTLLYALTVGPSVQWGLRRFGVIPRG